MKTYDKITRGNSFCIFFVVEKTINHKWDPSNQLFSQLSSNPIYLLSLSKILHIGRRRVSKVQDVLLGVAEWKDRTIYFLRMLVMKTYDKITGWNSFSIFFVIRKKIHYQWDGNLPTNVHQVPDIQSLTKICQTGALHLQYKDSLALGS